MNATAAWFEVAKVATPPKDSPARAGLAEESLRSSRKDRPVTQTGVSRKEKKEIQSKVARRQERATAPETTQLEEFPVVSDRMKRHNEKMEAKKKKDAARRKAKEQADKEHSQKVKEAEAKRTERNKKIKDTASRAKDKTKDLAESALRGTGDAAVSYATESPFTAPLRAAGKKFGQAVTGAADKISDLRGKTREEVIGETTHLSDAEREEALRNPDGKTNMGERLSMLSGSGKTGQSTMSHILNPLSRAKRDNWRKNLKTTYGGNKPPVGTDTPQWTPRAGLVRREQTKQQENERNDALLERLKKDPKSDPTTNKLIQELQNAKTKREDEKLRTQDISERLGQRSKEIQLSPGAVADKQKEIQALENHKESLDNLTDVTQETLDARRNEV